MNHTPNSPMIDVDEITIFLSGIRIFQHLNYDIIEDISLNIMRTD